MRKYLYLIAVVAIFSSCNSHKPVQSYRPVTKPVTTVVKPAVKPSSSDASLKELARAGQKLGFDVTMGDNRRLMTESASWVGVPYRAGGTDRGGVDCSGLVYTLYTSVFGKRFERCSSADLYEKYCTKLNASQLRQGDLVFFTTDNSGSRIGHSGIYLKNGKFIHASSSKGVIVSNLNDQYWSKHWYAGGKVK